MLLTLLTGAIAGDSHKLPDDEPNAQGRWRAALTLRSDPARAGGVVVDDLKELSPATVPEIAASEVQPPNPSPQNDAVDTWGERRDRMVNLANYLADEWSVHSARGFIVRYGLDLCARVTEELDDLKREGDLGDIRNPGGYWVAFVRDYTERKRRESKSWHPGRPDELD